MMGTRWSKKFSDRFSRFDTIPECDRHPASQPPSHVAVAITLNAQASSLKIMQKLIIIKTNIATDEIIKLPFET